jgi:hypothetical protein
LLSIKCLEVLDVGKFSLEEIEMSQLGYENFEGKKTYQISSDPN